MESGIGLERRQLKRFSLDAIAMVETVSPGAEKMFQMRTRDISSNGAFFPMKVPLPEGEKVKVTLFLAVSELGRISELARRAKIVMEGQVVRSNNQGMAVEFGEHFAMSPIAV